MFSSKGWPNLRRLATKGDSSVARKSGSAARENVAQSNLQIDTVRMDASDRIEFEPVIAGCSSIHCHLDGYYVARITLHREVCAIDGPKFPYCKVPSVEHAMGVVRIWVRRSCPD